MANRQVKVGISAMIEPEFRQVAGGLFERGEVDVVEWSFDTAWGSAKPSEWLCGVLRDFSDRDRLFGHGVSYSLLSADEEAFQSSWLKSLAEELTHYRYQHVSEHFGFMHAGRFLYNTPLPVPLTPAFLAVAKQNMLRLHDVVQGPLGLENLAFAFCESDVFRQGEFLEKLLEPVDGFLLLDVHNLFCQSVNFNIPISRLLSAYPLHLVREIHISGGSWFTFLENGAEVTLRRDSHDGPIPPEVYEGLRLALSLCPKATSVIYEWIGLDLAAKQGQCLDFEQDYLAVKNLVKECT